MIRDDEYLERIVAGIHAVTTTGADVTWNEKINGRQFDVVVRFKLGTLRYLVLAEVKNKTRKAEASDIDAFVNKARDQNANKAVFVTAAGFQDGAVAVAKRHSVDIFTVTYDDELPCVPETANWILSFIDILPKDILPTVSFGEPHLIANIENITLLYTDGKEFELPDEQSQMTYYCNKSKFTGGRTLVDIFQDFLPGPLELGRTRTEEIRLDPPQHIEPPDTYFFPSGTISTIKLKIAGRMGRPLRGNIRIDPGTLMLPVVYTNVITGEASRFKLDQLPLGVKTISVGGFYFIPHPLMYYYCASINNNLARLHLIESFQNGQLLTATITQDIKYSSQYIPVTERSILKRLQCRLHDFIHNREKK